METAFMVGNMAWSAVLFAAAGYMIKRWMDKQESTVVKNDEDLHRNLNAIYEQLRIANGRTAVTEGAILTIKALCDERHGK